MVEINLAKLFSESFKEDPGALIKILSRQPESERDRIIIELAKVSGLNHQFWRNKIAALGSSKKK